MATTPTVINTIGDLQAIQNNLSGYYVLGANVDASGFNFASISDFSGVLDGQGHTIDNLQNTLFNKIDFQGLVENVNLANVSISNAALALENDGGILNSSVTGNVYANPVAGVGCGALVSYNLGLIDLSHSTAAVHGAAGGGIGGLVGINGTTGTISNSYATGSITGNNVAFENTPEAGGLVDANDGLITGSYAAGAVNSFTGVVGGLVGTNGGNGQIVNSYASGSVTGTIVGGLAGENFGKIEDAYAVGFLTERDDRFLPGGLVGFAGDPSRGLPQSFEINSFWDVETSGTSFDPLATGLATSQLQSGVLPVGFDSTIWVDTAGQFPLLRWQTAVAPVNRPPAIDSAHSIVSGTINERPSVTGSLALDLANGAIAFTDADLSDRPTASVIKQQLIYHDAQGTDDTAQLTAAQITAFENALLIVPDAGNTNAGKIDWGFNTQDSTFDFLGIGETITVTKTVEIDDGHGGKIDQDLLVTINGANDNPIAQADLVKVENSHTVISGAETGVLANDSDPDTHDTLQVSAVTGLSIDVGHPIAGKYGSLTLSADGSYSYAENLVGRLLSDLNISEKDTFTYTVSDSHGGTASSTLTFDTRESAPPVAKADIATVAVGQLLSTDAGHGVLINDSDPDGDTLSVSSVSFGTKQSQVSSAQPGTAVGKFGALTLKEDGSYSYVETSSHVPASGAQDVFSYSVSDGHGGTARSTITIDVTAGPSLAEYYNAAEAVYLDNAVGMTTGAHPPSSTGLTLLLDSRDPSLQGNSSWLADGMFAQAFEDKWGNVIIAFEGSIIKPSDPSFLTPYAFGSRGADLDILTGLTPKAFVDAQNFAFDAAQFVHQNLGSNPIYLTGHSLGGAEAQDVAFIINPGENVSGVTFGAPGDPTLSAPVKTPNFIDYVDYGDPVGNFGNHFGTVQHVGSPLNATVLTVAEIEALVTHGLSLAEVAGIFHPLTHYASDLGLHLHSDFVV